MNPRFPVLSTVALVLRIAGWIHVGVACLYGVVVGFLQPLFSSLGTGRSFHASDLLPLVVGLMGAVFGLITVAFGEGIGVLFAIEENTRPRMRA